MAFAPPARTPLLILPVLILAVTGAGKPPPAKPAASKAERKNSAVAPLTAEKGLSEHSPFSGGDCSFCHSGSDPKNPGPVNDTSNELCFACHEEYRETLAARPVKHKPVTESCIGCHNPHNSRYPSLLLDAADALCLKCHEPIKTLLATAKVQHGAVTTGKKCLTCHTPHASNIDALLIKLPMDLCVECHNRDDMTDPQGRKLQNMKKLLDDNPEWHAPLAGKDCSVCHNPHASQNFRLLGAEYPAKFYAPYNPANYALCYQCHNDQVAATPETTTLTGFRDGARNLHYLHVHKTELGRTCRACHEVHASKFPNHIRDAVPYGSKGWMLKIQFAKTEEGGTCAKSCHVSKSYSRTAKAGGK